MKLSVIIPVYNEEKTISKVIDKVVAVDLAEIKKEIIIVDDGSSDKTKNEIDKHSKNPIIKVIYHKRNLGKGFAVRSGIKEAEGDYILIQDADFEYNPNDIQRLFDPIKKNIAQVVYGTRLKRMPDFSRDERTFQFFIHYMGNKFLSFVASILYGRWITDIETGYKLFPKKSLEKIRLNARSFDFESEITAKLLKKGYEILEIPISTNPRGYDEGKKINTIKDGIVAFWTLIKYRFVD